MNSQATSITCEGLSYRYPGSDQNAVEDVSFTVDPGQVAALVGPSGCGKSTLLRNVAGLLTPTAGKLIMDGTDTVAVAADKRMVGWVPQSYALFGHFSVAENVAFGLRARRVPKRERRDRVAESLELCRITELADRRPDNLSGGQRQRVAIARALATRPRVLLLDEPLSALDPQLRKQLRADLLTLLQRSGVTTLLVTHDQGEALSMADRVAVLRAGRLEQYAAPQQLWSSPACGFVAEFVSEARLIRPEQCGDGSWQVADGMSLPGYDGTGGSVAAIRPSDLVADPDGAPVRVSAVLYAGTNWLVTGDLPGKRTVSLYLDQEIEVGDTVRVGLRPGSRIAMVRQ